MADMKNVKSLSPTNASARTGPHPHLPPPACVGGGGGAGEERLPSPVHDGTLASVLNSKASNIQSTGLSNTVLFLFSLSLQVYLCLRKQTKSFKTLHSPSSTLSLFPHRHVSQRRGSIISLHSSSLLKPP